MKQTQTKKMSKSEVSKLKDIVQQELKTRPKKPKGPKTRRSNNPPSSISASTGPKVHKESFSEQMPTTLSGSTSALAGTLSINPGDSSLFSRLVQLANLYQEYRFTKFKVRYIPNGSAFAANNQTGEIVLSATDNFHSARSSSVSIARARTPSCAGNAWEPLTLVVPGSICAKWRSLRSNTSTFGAEPNLFDFLVEVFVFQTPNSSNIGYIEFTGEVEMRGDYVSNLVNPVLTNRVWSMRQPNAQSVTSTTLTSLLLAGMTSQPNFISSGYQGAGTSALTFYGGTYLVLVRAMVSATTITSAYLLSAISGDVFNTAIPGATPDVGGSTFSAAAVELTDAFIVVAAEDSTWQFAAQVNIIGTGTINVTNWSATVISL